MHDFSRRLIMTEEGQDIVTEDVWICLGRTLETVDEESFQERSICFRE
jgi:hypothetical protein